MTFGKSLFMRVPFPAAKIIAESGELEVGVVWLLMRGFEIAATLNTLSRGRCLLCDQNWPA